jgi:hypothetical protein
MELARRWNRGCATPTPGPWGRARALRGVTVFFGTVLKIPVSDINYSNWIFGDIHVEEKCCSIRKDSLRRRNRFGCCDGLREPRINDRPSLRSLLRASPKRRVELQSILPAACFSPVVYRRGPSAGPSRLTPSRRSSSDDRAGRRCRRRPIWRRHRRCRPSARPGCRRESRSPG